MKNRTRILVIGLDCASPELVFEEFRDQLPNLRQLMENGAYARMESCHPPITIPAWMVMCTSTDPGRLGIYGFRHRRGFSYKDGYIANALSVKPEKIWDILGRQGKKVCIVSIPPAYPPTPVNGELISCFITPDANRDYTYPAALKQEIEKIVGPYPFDVEFRIENRDELLRNLNDMTEKHFQIIEHLLTTRPWDFFMFNEIGVDRLHHAFWKFFDKNHPKYVPGNQYEKVGLEYYKRIDDHIGRLLAKVGPETTVLVISDHGAKGMKGAFCFNQWLINEGYLVLKQTPHGIIDFDKAEVDWSRTKAWAWGGYYARVFFNVKGREAQGVIEVKDLDHEKTELTKKILEIRDPDGRKMDTKVYRPEELYEVSIGDKPDLMVYFDDLYWRSAGTLGHDSLYLSENDTGPDDAVHAQHGIFILQDPHIGKVGKIPDVKILDVAPTLLRIFGISVPTTMKGKPIECSSK
ncbi:MAG TPA: alkaline phosphatase family protein [Candidatus Acidoferrum sp.]|nr:alkaline phosphatase family protein [Candidatus Acidoferrum sp.]